MPTKPSKGDHGHADGGSHGRGDQKATQGSTVSGDVAEGRREAGLDDAVDRDVAGD
jgi:hypothetical protein